MKKIFKLICAVLVALTLLIVGTLSLAPNLAPQEASAAITYKKGANTISSSYQSSKYYSNLQSLSLTGDGVTDVLAVALSQLGYQEGNSAGSYGGTSSGSKNYTEYCYNMGKVSGDYGGSNYPWCATFVSWSLLQSGVTTLNSMSDMCRSHTGDINYIWREISCVQWATQLKNFGYFKNSAANGGSYKPKSGDLIFFKTPISHIGIVVYSDASKVYTIEGNTSDGSGVDTNGGGVYYKSYSLTNSNINGYGTLPYQSVASAPKVDYTGVNKTAGLYVSRQEIPLGSVTIPKYTVFSATSVSGNTLTINYGGVTGTAYVTNTNALQISAMASSGGGNSGGSSGGASNPSTSNVLVGVDVSKWQGTIDWAKVKQDGIDFAMLRICTYSSSTHTYSIDPTFAANVAGATEQGIALGIYFYSYANSLAEVTVEANMVVDILDDYPATFSFPIAYDAEHSSIQSFATDACTTFCSILESKGYFSMVYSNTNWYNNILTPASKLADIALWQAHYKTAYAGTTPAGAAALASSRPTINNNDGNVKIWQFTDSGVVNGIGGGVDMNVAYYDYSQLIPSLGLNGYGSGATTTSLKYVGMVETVGGTPVDSWAVISSPITTVCPITIGQDCTLTLGGWQTVDGGQGDFYYSVDGVSWTKATSTRRAGNDVKETAEALGVATCDVSNARYTLSANLSACQGKTVSVQFAIESKTTGQKIKILTMTGVSVPTSSHTHNYTYTTQTPATCDSAEVLLGTCACGATTTSTGASARGHAYGSWQLTTSPTTDATGLLTRKCDHDSSHTKTMTLPKLNQSDYSYTVSGNEAKYTISFDGQTFSFSIILSSTTTHVYVGVVEKVGGQATNWPIINAPITQNCPVSLGQDCTLTFQSGWMTVDGGQGDFYYSVDGAVWMKATATRKAGDDVKTTAEALGVAACDVSNARYVSLSINLAAYQGKTVSVHYAIESKATGEKIKFLTVANVAVPTHVHSCTYTTVTYPTCTTERVEKGTCACGETLTRTSAALGHSYGTWACTIEPTMVSTGLLTKTCTRDSSHTRTTVLPALNDSDYDHDVITAPTCEMDGEDEYTYEIDNREYTFSVSISALGHAYGAWQLTTAPTLTETGLLTRVCSSDSSHTQTRTLAVLNELTYGYAVVTESTCEKEGKAEYTIVVDGCAFVFSVALPVSANHTYGAWQLATNPTLEEEGLLTRSCARNVAHKQTWSLPALSVVDYDYAIVRDPSCESQGEEKYSIIIDSQTFAFSASLDAIGHSFGEWVVEVAPTLSSTGLLKKQCANNPVHTQTLILSALNKTSYTYTVSAPFCGSAGEETYSLAMDGQMFTFIIALDVVEHAYRAWEMTTEPTFTSGGLLTATCGNDASHTKTHILPALNDVDYTHIEASCESEDKYTILVDGQTIVITLEDSDLGHAYGDWTVVAAPTLDATGALKKVCIRDASHTQTLSLPVLNATDYTYSVAVAPSCEEEGSATYAIDIDGQTVTFTVVLDSLGHDYGSWQLTTSPMLNRIGLLTKTCSHDATHTQTKTLPVLNANKYEYSVVTEPLCERSGLANYSIEVDRQTFSFAVILDALGHADVDGNHVCDTCSTSLQSGNTQEENNAQGGGTTDSGKKDKVKVGCKSSAGLGTIGVMAILVSGLFLSKKKRRP